ncbi:uncharacterized protein LOC135092138 [Scylla paramamosain]|uniref:uncharacterized protein LOC135092138 n=1 Tax=Scylla paramamosain TaxID=85552 RepID=UPI0030838311
MHLGTATLTPPLLALLTKLETKYFQGVRVSPPLVLLRGQKLLVTRDLPAYTSALHHLHAHSPAHTPTLRLLDTTVTRVRMVGVNGSVYYALEDEAWRGGRVTAHEWRVLVCFTYTDGDSSACLPRKLFPALRLHQKVGRIPGLRSTLWRREAFCEVLHSSRLVPPLRALSPPCYALPIHAHHLSAAVHALPDAAEWVVKGAHSGRGVEVMDNRRMMDMLREGRLGAGQVVQLHWGPPLEVLGAAVGVRFYLLITSLQPLRAYLHSHAEVTFRLPAHRGYGKIPGRAWTFAALAAWVGREGGKEAVRVLVTHTETLLTSLSLTADLLLPAKVNTLRRHPRRYRCEGCYHLLGVDLVYNSTFHPTIVEVDGQPDLSPPTPAHPVLAAGRERVARDVLTLLTRETKVAGHVQEALAEAADNVGVIGVDCLISHELCLTLADLEYLLETRRENWDYEHWENGVYKGQHLLNIAKSNQSETDTEDDDVREKRDDGRENENMKDAGVPKEDDKGYLGKQSEKDDGESTMSDGDMRGQGHGFVMIYPSPVGHLYDQVIRDLYQALSTNTSAAIAPSSYLLTESWRHMTRDLHGLVTLLEAFFRPLPPGVSPLLASLDLHETDAVQQKWMQQQQAGQHHCMDDPATAPYLQKITLVPEVVLTPSFTPLVTSYWGQVEYEVITVQVAGVALHCQAEARLDDKFGPSTLVNYTLGLGENRVVVAVVEIGHSEPWTLNTYTLHLTRLPPPPPPPQVKPALPATPREVCALRQECELRILPSEPCGLTRESVHASWDAFLAQRHGLPFCTKGDAQGRWVVPCVSCGGRSGCDWVKAVWQPFTCTHHPLNTHALQQCLKGKTLVFVGDSTNRGMLYALLEWVNGTLTSWDKTHDLRLVRGANGGDTTFAFAYYPRFWLPSNKRPAFDHTLNQLLQRVRPLTNSSDTVVVVGGVHWLAAQHLHMLTATLQREGLEGALVVVKTAGAGFHVAAPGVHTVSKKDHARLLQHSLHLASVAHVHGYLVLDTFNMTAARYQHFLQGKCACHFHKKQVTNHHQKHPSRKTV